MEGPQGTSSQMDEAGQGLTLWDLRSHMDDLQSAEIQLDTVKMELEDDVNDSFDCSLPDEDQISVMAIKKGYTLSCDRLNQQRSVNKFKEHYESFDESQIDNDGWFVDKPSTRVQAKLNIENKEGRKSEQNALKNSSTNVSTTSKTLKRPFSAVSPERSGKIINLTDIRSEENVNSGQCLSYQINKKRKHGIHVITTIASSASAKPQAQDLNRVSDPSISCNSIGQIGSMSLPTLRQEREREHSCCAEQPGKSSDMKNSQLPNVVLKHPQQIFKTILDLAVKMAEKATVAQSGISSVPTPSGHVLDKQAPKMVSNKKSESRDANQKLRPSERARILRRIKPKPSQPEAVADDRTLFTLIPVVPPPSNPVVPPPSNPVVPPPSNPVTEKDEVKKEGHVMVTRSLSKKLDQQDQEQVAKPVAQPTAIPQVAAVTYRPIAPKAQEVSQPKCLATMFLPLFEIVPVNAPKKVHVFAPAPKKLPILRPKPSSTRRKQDPLLVQTRCDKWRQEEKEMIVEESTKTGNQEPCQEVVNLISDDEEEDKEALEVVKVEVKTEEEVTDDVNIIW